MLIASIVRLYAVYYSFDFFFLANQQVVRQACYKFRTSIERNMVKFMLLQYCFSHIFPLTSLSLNQARAITIVFTSSIRPVRSVQTVYTKSDAKERHV